MSVTTEDRRLSRAAAARLLRGEPPAGAREARLAAVLAAASARRLSNMEGREALAREHLAMAAFRDARLQPVRPPRRAGLRTTIARAVTIKVGFVAAAVLGLGGVALAATTGNLPGASHAGSSQATSPAGSPRPRPEPPASAGPGEQVPAGLWWLCQNYVGRNANQRAKALDDPAFEDLVDNAGAKDRDRVDAFCAKVLEREPDPHATTGAPTPHLTGPKPHPTTSHPGNGKPSTAPAQH